MKGNKNQQHIPLKQFFEVPGVQVNLKSVDGCTPIMRALRRCKFEAVQAMMRVRLFFKLSIELVAII